MRDAREIAWNWTLALICIGASVILGMASRGMFQ